MAGGFLHDSTGGEGIFFVMFSILMGAFGRILNRNLPIKVRVLYIHLTQSQCHPVAAHLKISNSLNRRMQSTLFAPSLSLTIYAITTADSLYCHTFRGGSNMGLNPTGAIEACFHIVGVCI